ncbi:thiamine phosphate synthase [Candidatus Pelagibacter sp.]|nr:thiamine phosphate synthase [Candidatus Pelagibacter sp.]
MRINKKKFIYLVSPNKIYPKFYNDLKQILKTGKVSLFQLRLKKYPFPQKIVIGKIIQKICKKNGVKFLVNDDPILSKKLNADGCHLGQKDMDIKNARKIIGNKIIGVTCHNSINLAKAAVEDKANYIALGAFFSTTTKKVKHKASIKILNKVKKLTKTPIVAIGGINSDNYKKLLLNKANLLAISGYIWNNKKYKPLESVEKLK